MSTPPRSNVIGSADGLGGVLLPSSTDQLYQQLQEVEDDSVMEPPSMINVPTPEDMSCASSVTTHFKDAELFVPHMYPSTQNLHDTDDVDDPTFQPVNQQQRGVTNKKQPILPPLAEEASQDPADSKSIHTTSSQKLDTNHVLKEHEKAMKKEASVDVPSMASLESKINQKTQIYSVRQISFESDVQDTGIIDPAIQKEQREHEVAGNMNELIEDGQSADSTFRGKDRSNETVSENHEGATSAPPPSWIQEMPMPVNMSSVAVQESVPGAHAVQAFRFTEQTHQPSSMDADAEDGDEEEAGEDIQPPPSESLAEARPVAEDDLPIATADNGSHNSQKKRGNLWVYLMEGLFVLLVVAGILIGAVCGTGHCSQKVYVDGSSTMAPTTTRDAVEAPKIEVTLTLILGRDYFEHVEESGDDLDVDLAEFLIETRLKAFDWIVNQDPLQLSYDSPNLVQRFLLALFYYQTTRHKPWKECNPVASPQGSATSGFCYEPMYYGGEATSNIWGDQWLSPSHECQWAGITCETVQSMGRTLVELQLYWNHLNGPLPWEITRLPPLRLLWLNSNMLTGVPPPRLFSKKPGFALESLDLSWNQFSGTIPVEWVTNLLEGNGKLTNLLLQGNTLTGRIPSELGLLPLKVLILGSNTLTGSISQELFSQTSLEWLYLSGNNLTGTLPSEIGLLTNLEYLRLNHTYISGSLPSESGLANQLQEMVLSNTNMQGAIPEELYAGLDNLQLLDLDGCNFTGTISSSLGLLKTRLRHLHLSNNNFSGTIPNEIAALTRLQQFVVNGNQITGTFPISFCHNFEYVDSVGEVALVADCLPNTETGVPLIQCASDCCTSCCDETGVCLST